MKKAIIIPMYLSPNPAEACPASEGLRSAKRAAGSLNQLEGQDFTLILSSMLLGGNLVLYHRSEGMSDLLKGCWI
jgi:hypothetical protein